MYNLKSLSGFLEFECTSTCVGSLAVYLLVVEWTHPNMLKQLDSCIEMTFPKE